MKKEKETEKSDDVKATDNITVSSTIFTTLIDEALWAHRERSYIDMFDCVMALCYMTKGLIYVNNKNSTVDKRLNDMIYGGVCTLDMNNKEVKIPAYNIMSVSCVYCITSGKDTAEIFDARGNLVRMQIYKLHETYDFIGRLLLIALFEIIDDSSIVLPPELVVARKSIGEE